VYPVCHLAMATRFGVGVLLALGACSSFSTPRLSIDPIAVSVSGISSGTAVLRMYRCTCRLVRVLCYCAGADMAAQLLAAYSQSLCGSGVFAGQAYHCKLPRGIPADPRYITSTWA
jgi:hypothetical protein